MLRQLAEHLFSDKESNNLGGAGLNKETIMITINTFKKFCLKAGTKKARMLL